MQEIEIKNVTLTLQLQSRAGIAKAKVVIVLSPRIENTNRAVCNIKKYYKWEDFLDLLHKLNIDCVTFLKNYIDSFCYVSKLKIKKYHEYDIFRQGRNLQKLLCFNRFDIDISIISQ